MNAGNHFHYSWKKTVSKREIHIVPFIFVSMGEKGGMRGGRKKCPPDLGRLDPGWGGVVVTGLTLTHLMPVCLFSPLPLSVLQVSGSIRRTHKDTSLIRAVRCAHTGLICFETARLYLFFSCVKRRSKVSPPFQTALVLFPGAENVVF